MADTHGTGLIDVSDIDLEALKGLDIPALNRVLERLADEGVIVASFQSSV
ncbi:FxSxx-COOH cyclophane-containing RiPP peptide [Nonomuraea sp. NPDC049486]|nr:FxSxx-COOH cyclophane-containing RiPP peptide [Nonomuraea sp. C10]TXK39689.1 FXSXX-COOH protein [Nonomuraea sp. C10]